MEYIKQFTSVNDQISQYRDQRYEGSEAELERALSTSTTLYVGNLSFYTTEEQIYELFSKCGEVKRIIMGLNKKTSTPCGFCFAEYYSREDAEDCIKWINGSRLDDRVIRTDWDAGFKEGRQFGRGKSGGQVRDEFRTDYDPGRGGYGTISTPPPQKRSFAPPREDDNAEPPLKRGRFESERD